MIKKYVFIVILAFIFLITILYRFAYELGKDNKFFCEITNGRWNESEKTYYGEIVVSEPKGCLVKSDIIGELRK